jgi:hypothetical protein
MPANCPPPEPFFDVVTPGQAKDEVLALDAQASIFDRDVARELSAHLLGKGYDEFGNLTYLPGWAEFNLSWSQWWLAWQEFKRAHDEWSENLDGASVVRQVELRKCELIDYRTKLRELGGKPTGPEPSFTQPSKTLGDLTALALVGIGAYLLVNLKRK